MTDPQLLEYLKYSLELTAKTIAKVDDGKAPWRAELFDDLVECEASCHHLLSRIEEVDA